MDSTIIDYQNGNVYNYNYNYNYNYTAFRVCLAHSLYREVVNVYNYLS